MKYKVSEYAKMNNVSIRTVWRWIERGDLVTEKTSTGRVRIILNKDVVLYLPKDDPIERQKLIDYCTSKGYSVSKITVANDLKDILLDKSNKMIVTNENSLEILFDMKFIQSMLQLDDRKIEVI